MANTSGCSEPPEAATSSQQQMNQEASSGINRDTGELSRNDGGCGQLDCCEKKLAVDRVAICSVTNSRARASGGGEGFEGASFYERDKETTTTTTTSLFGYAGCTDERPLRRSSSFELNSPQQTHGAVLEPPKLRATSNQARQTSQITTTTTTILPTKVAVSQAFEESSSSSLIQSINQQRHYNASWPTKELEVVELPVRRGLFERLLNRLGVLSFKRNYSRCSSSIRNALIVPSCAEEDYNDRQGDLSAGSASNFGQTIKKLLTLTSRDDNELIGSTDTCCYLKRAEAFKRRGGGGAAQLNTERKLHFLSEQQPSCSCSISSELKLASSINTDNLSPPESSAVDMSSAASSSNVVQKKETAQLEATSGIGSKLMRNCGCNVSNNKFIVEEKLLRRQKQVTRCKSANKAAARLNDGRSTYCSALGADDRLVDCDGSSFSSMQNCFTESSNMMTSGHHQDCESSAKDSNGKRPARKGKFGATLVALEIGDGRPNDEAPKCSANNTVKQRENWDKNIEFLLAVIGFAVDLGNVWRFPYICYRNGGGAFLIPYTIMFILGGLPIFYLEMSLGQYFSSGCLTVWKRVCPFAKGIGYAMCVLNFFTGLYYNTIISWAVFFFVESFTTVLPWTSCDNPWNREDCRTIGQRQALKNSANYYTALRTPSNTSSSVQHYSSPTKDYFEREVLRVHYSTGVDDLGSIRRPLAGYLGLVFICIYFAIWKGVKSTGKAVWITALLPYLVLIPLLIRGVFLEGAWLGIRYYLYPQWEKIVDVDVWVEAAKQIYFSLGPGFGTLMALSSYNKFHHNCRRDALIAASVNYFASFISGLVIFAVLGYMATMENVSVSDVATEGPGLVFQVYPEGLATMRYSSIWSVLFFIMVITLGIDSTFGGLESVITGLCDEYPKVLGANRGVFIGLLIVLIYICSLPTTTYGGNYVIYLLESYGTSLSLLFIVLVETIIVCWLYGTDRFCKNLEEMSGQRPGAYWRICWKYISPTILLMIFFAACGQELEKYHTLTNGDYTYPGWAPFVGLLMTGSSVCCIPIYAIYYLRTKTSGSFWKRLKLASKPVESAEGAQDGEETLKQDKMRENSIQLNTVKETL